MISVTLHQPIATTSSGPVLACLGRTQTRRYHHGGMGWYECEGDSPLVIQTAGWCDATWCTIRSGSVAGVVALSFVCISAVVAVVARSRSSSSEALVLRTRTAGST